VPYQEVSSTEGQGRGARRTKFPRRGWVASADSLFLSSYCAD